MQMVNTLKMAFKNYKIKVLNFKKRYLPSQFEWLVYSLLSETKNSTNQYKPLLCLVHYISDTLIYEDFLSMKIQKGKQKFIYQQ